MIEGRRIFSKKRGRGGVIFRKDCNGMGIFGGYRREGKAQFFREKGKILGRGVFEEKIFKGSGGVIFKTGRGN